MVTAFCENLKQQTEIYIIHTDKTEKRKTYYCQFLYGIPN
jgi:hypothetical protein